MQERSCGKRSTLEMTPWCFANNLQPYLCRWMRRWLCFRPTRLRKPPRSLCQPQLESLLPKTMVGLPFQRRKWLLISHFCHLCTWRVIRITDCIFVFSQVLDILRLASPMDKINKQWKKWKYIKQSKNKWNDIIKNAYGNKSPTRPRWTNTRPGLLS